MGSINIGATGVLGIELGRISLTPVSDRAGVTGSVTFDSGANLKLSLSTSLT